MKIVFISNFMNHHQKDLCDYLNKNSDDFRFIETGVMPRETRNLGYNDLSSLGYVINKDYLEKNEEEIKKLIYNADVVIYGANSLKYLDIRTAENKLSFIFSERLWKKGYYRRFIPFIRKKVDYYYKNIDKELYVLCASCYLVGDLSLIGVNALKCYKWGYYPPLDNTDPNVLSAGKELVFTIIFVGRLIDWKHCDDVLRLANNLKKDGYRFKLNIVGDGKEKKKLQRYTRRKKLENEVSFLGSMPQEKVREKMKESHVMVFSSDYKEGWGAVLNEAMNSGCVPIVSHAVGSSRFLIKNGENGFIYKCHDINGLKDRVELLYNDRNKLSEMSKKANATITDVYNGEVAGQRFIEFVTARLNGEETKRYNEGPMSPAPVAMNRDRIGPCLEDK